MSDPPNKVDEDVRDEVKVRLSDGEKPDEIAEDDGMPSRRTIYNIKDELENEQQQQREMEAEVFRTETAADRDAIIGVLSKANVGIKQSGEPKAKVEKALNAIEFDDAWDDPHYVADTLVEEANMTREWANRVVRKAYDAPDFPYIEQGQEGISDDRKRGRGRRQGRRSRGNQQGGRSSRDRGRGGRRDGRDQQDNEDSQLRKQMQQLQSTVSQLAEAIADDDDDDDDAAANMIEVEQNGKMMKVPYHVAVSQGMLGNNGGDDKDFMDKIREAKEAGIIPDPDDFQQDDGDDIFDQLEKLETLGVIGDDDGSEEVEVMREMMDEMSDTFAESQQAVATQMSAAISQLSEDSDDEDDELSLDDLEDWWEEKQKEDELDRLETELSSLREEIREQNKRGSRSPNDPDRDPEVVKQRDQLNHEKDQLELAKSTVEDAPEQIAKGVQDGLIPLLDRMQMGQGAGGGQMWTPPGGGGDDAPEYEPEVADGRQGSGEQQEGAQQSPTDAQQRDYPDAGEQPDRQPQGDVTQEEAEEVRGKLGLESDGDDEQAEA